MRRVIDAIARYELVVLGVATPFLLFPGIWTPIGAALILLTWACRWASTGRVTRRTPMDVPIILLLIMLGVSLIPSVDLQLSLNRLWIYILGIALFYGMVNGLHTERQIHNMGIGLVLVGLAVAVVSLVSTDFQAAQLVKLPSLYDRLPPPLIRGLPGSGVIEHYDLVNPRVAAGALAILLPVPLAYLVFGEGWKLKLASGLTALVMGGVLLLTQSPQGVLGLGAALLLIGVWWSRWTLLAVPLGLGAFLGTSSVLDLQYVVNRWAGPKAIGHLSFGIMARWQHLHKAMSMIGDMPYTGVGLNTYPLMETFYSHGRGHASHAHNTLVQTAVDLGIPGLVAVLALVIALGYAVAGAYRGSSRANRRALLIGVCGAVAAWLAYGLLDSITLGHKPGVAVWVGLGLAVTARLQLGNTGAPTVPCPSPFSRRWLLVIVLPAFVLIVILGLTAYKTIGALYVNLGLIQVHGALGGRDWGRDAVDNLGTAEGCFRQAIHWDPSRGRAHRLLHWIRGLNGEVSSKPLPVDTSY